MSPQCLHQGHGKKAALDLEEENPNQQLHDKLAARSAKINLSRMWTTRSLGRRRRGLICSCASSQHERVVLAIAGPQIATTFRENLSEFEPSCCAPLSIWVCVGDELI